MNGKLSQKEKLIAYALNKDMGYKQKDIAEFMAKKQPDKSLSQPTIANAIKETGFKIQINKLQRQYQEVKQELHEQGFREKQNLIENTGYKIDPDEPSFFDK